MLLIDYGADINSKNAIGETPLMLAARKGNSWTELKTIFVIHQFQFLGHENVTKILIENGANVNASLFSGRTALYYAIQKGSLALRIEIGDFFF